MNAHLALFTAGLVVAMAGPCSDWANAGGKCTKGGEAREPGDGHACDGGTCNEAECCGFKCEQYFTQNGGKCGTTEKVNSGHKIYGSSTYDLPGKKFSGTIDWTVLGAGVKDGCCETSCVTAAKAKCAAGKTFRDTSCVFYTGDAVTNANPSGKVDTCDQPDENTAFNQKRAGCCETETCMHSTCNLLPSNFDTNCNAHGVNKCPDCNNLEKDGKVAPKGQFDKCAACVNVAAAHAKCVDCIVCYGTQMKPQVVVTKPPSAKGSASKSNVVGASFFTLSVALVAALFA